MKIPVFRITHAVTAKIADELRAYELVVAVTARTGAAALVSGLRQELGRDEDDESEDGAFLLHLSCSVEPMMEYG